MKKYRSTFIIALVCALVGGIAYAAPQMPPKVPRLSGFSARPLQATQCEPIVVSFAVTNAGTSTIYSQPPYSGSTYNMYQSMSDKMLLPQADRYMVAVTLNGGNDGYPFRWGFRGYLASGRTTIIAGQIAFPTTGNYTLNAVLMKGNRVVSAGSTKTTLVQVAACDPQPLGNPVHVPPVNYYYNGVGGATPLDAYMVNGRLLVQLQPFVSSINSNMAYTNGSYIITTGPNQVILYPNSPYMSYNAYGSQLPISTYMINGYAYVSPRYLSPYLGLDMYWDPYTWTLWFQNPYSYGYGYGYDFGFNYGFGGYPYGNYGYRGPYGNRDPRFGWGY